mmetsp:Transcript_118671/g.186235  ORF Transcript_118671/g.186235 Transcript_118671/m.186235 type:complete len:81 (+) Transcript_118671:644-886(+)
MSMMRPEHLLGVIGLFGGQDLAPYQPDPFDTGVSTSAFSLITNRSLCSLMSQRKDPTLDPLKSQRSLALSNEFKKQRMMT